MKELLATASLELQQERSLCIATGREVITSTQLILGRLGQQFLDMWGDLDIDLRELLATSLLTVDKTIHTNYSYTVQVINYIFPLLFPVMSSLVIATYKPSCYTVSFIQFYAFIKKVWQVIRV